ncbi:unnamed protein product [Lactuca saligna]|uniref:Replication protein A 70 kDa DNA-binding subunit B/D first OB fold domain-containing protein n=1 Tax=Lactuca saligna TaxID=75948 RepID=A0AA35UVE6_LACSI|nr:unnamed protein product [Lactuca saligna]
MEIGNKVYLNNIDQIEEKSHIKVRVLKIWNFVRNNKVCSIEMIIMDEEGTQYQARVFNQNFSRFRHLLKEDESYIVIKPNMAAVTNGFSYTGLGEAKSHFEVTKLFINSDIYEINEFKNKLKCHDNFGITEKSITTLQSYSSSYTDDFKGNFPLKTICEITEPIKEMKFLLVASIINIRQNLPWYIIPINVQDCTGTIGLTLFDREARRLLNIRAYELKKIHDAAGDSDALFPMQLNVLKNRKFGFIVDITEYNVNNYNNIYTVLRVTEDMSIVSELESKIELMSNQSVALNQVALESDDVVQPVQKDVISQTDESFTPSTVDKSTATSPCKISGDLKRNLQEIYDVDSGYDLSSTKAKRKSTAEETPLLIPKIEK